MEEKMIVKWAQEDVETSNNLPNNNNNNNNNNNGPGEGLVSDMRRVTRPAEDRY